MSTEALGKSMQALRNEAATIIGNYQRQRDAIRQDRLLSSEGKDQQITAIYAMTAARVKELYGKEDKLLADKIESLQRSLVTQLGSGSSDVIAMRDAEDRADRLEKSSEAARVLERAIRVNDRSLAHAIVRRASDAGWTDVVAQATTAYPSVGETLKDIADVNDEIHSPGQSLYRAMAYNVSK
nr:hypothetical protein [uncultured Microbacterium sp.]